MGEGLPCAVLPPFLASVLVPLVYWAASSWVLLIDWKRNLCLVALLQNLHISIRRADSRLLPFRALLLWLSIRAVSYTHLLKSFAFEPVITSFTFFRPYKPFTTSSQLFTSWISSSSRWYRLLCFMSPSSSIKSFSKSFLSLMLISVSYTHLLKLWQHDWTCYLNSKTCSLSKI